MENFTEKFNAEDDFRGWEVWGQDKKSKEPKKLVWQPTEAAIEVSYERLLSEGFTDLLIKKVPPRVKETGGDNN